MMKLDSNATVELILKRARYDPDTGHFYAIEQRGKRKAGDRLGYADKLGYVKIAINGKWLLAHRVAWAIANGGAWPDGEIDHINGNPSDNRIANLRVATRGQNVVNGKFNTLNTSGFRGVSRVYRKRFGVRFQATLKRNGVNHYLGIFDTAEEAHAAYVAAAVKSSGEFFPNDATNVFIDPPKPKAEQTSFDLEVPA